MAYYYKARGGVLNNRPSTFSLASTLAIDEAKLEFKGGRQIAKARGDSCKKVSTSTYDYTYIY